MTYKKGVFKRLVFGLSESSKSKHVVKGEATVDVLGMCIYASPLPILDVKAPIHRLGVL